MSRSTTPGSINLLPVSIQTRLQTRDAIRLWTRILLVVSVVCVLGIVVGQFLAMGLNQKTLAVNSQIAEPQQLLAENIELRNQVRALTSTAGRRQQERNRYSPLVVLELVALIRKEIDGAMEIESFTFHEENTSKNETTKLKEVASIVLKLKTKGVANSAKIVSALRDSTRFAKVELASALEQIGGSKDGLRFSVRCVL